MPDKKLVISKAHPQGVLVDYTEAELAQRETDKVNTAAKQEAREAAVAQKAADQKSGNTKLLNLGLTQAEATALTGYTPPPPEAD